jgi:hypothetical protein
MSYSIVDTISEKLAPMYRKLNDFTISTLLGTECKVLRITKTIADVMGETQESVASYVIDNVIIKHPYAANVQMFETYNQIQQQITTGAIDLWDILPIELKVPLNDGNIETDAIAIKRGDIIVEILKDENQNKIPLIMECTKLFGSLFVKQVINKKYELTLYRGILSSSIREAVNTFVNEN